MSTKRYTDEFKIEAVRQIVEYGRPVAEVAERLGVSIHSLYGWKRQQAKAMLAGVSSRTRTRKCAASRLSYAGSLKSETS